jgi:hypothetical protein
MFYIYDRKELKFQRFTRNLLYINLSLLFVIGIASFAYGRYRNLDTLTEYEKELLLVNLTENKFSEEKLVSLIKELNIKFPHIVLAQAKTESGRFGSKIFLENHNLFGMKQATVRVNVAKGTQYGHAYYDNWEQSVYDYAFYQCRYLGAIRSESEYFAYLQGSYAEDPLYVVKLKKMISQENLKSKFQ